MRGQMTPPASMTIVLERLYFVFQSFATLNVMINIAIT